MKDKIIPSGVTAAKLRNFLVKHYGGEVVRTYGTSNPYDSIQSLELKICDSTNQVRLACVLKVQGWELVDGLFTKDGNSIIHSYKEFFKVYGPKKAKPFTIPYYD